jgi:hypothetical protein
MCTYCSIVAQRREQLCWCVCVYLAMQFRSLHHHFVGVVFRVQNVSDVPRALDGLSLFRRWVQERSHAGQLRHVQACEQFVACFRIHGPTHHPATVAPYLCTVVISCSMKSHGAHAPYVLKRVIHRTTRNAMYILYVGTFINVYMCIFYGCRHQIW